MKTTSFSRLLALIVTLMLSLSALTCTAFGASVAADYGISSSNNRIKVLEDRIAVYSHNSDFSYYISSDVLVSALSSSKGYSISYVDEDKNPATVSTVTDGYIKLSAEGEEDVYIPVSARGNTISDNFGYLPDGTELRAEIKNSNISYATSADPIGGKSGDDVSKVFTASSPAGSVKQISGIIYSGLDASQPYTFETSFFFDGGAGASVNYHYQEESYRLFYTNADGEFFYRVNSAHVKGTYKLAKGVWHRVAVTWDVFRNRFHVWLNGEQLTINCPYIGANQAGVVRFGITNESVNGKVSFADMDAYYGYYYPSSKPAVSSVSEYVSFDGDKLIFEEAQIPDAEALIAALDIDADSVGVFSDSTFANVCEGKLNSGAVLVLSKNGYYSYYTLEAPVLTVESIDTVSDGGDMKVTASLSYAGKIPCDVVMVVVTKNADGRPSKLYSSSSATVGADAVTFEVTAFGEEDKPAEVFFINNWTNRISYFGTVSSVN